MSDNSNHNSHLPQHCNTTHVDEGALRWLLDVGCDSGFLDIGCATGGMVTAARKMGFDRCVGIDLDAPKVEGCIKHDFRDGPFKTGKSFDVVWCVELLEHIEEEFADNVLDTIVDAEPVIIVWTAAPPGTPGRGHVNCQPIDYWLRKMVDHNIFMLDASTKEIRKASTMRKNFIRSRGYVSEFDKWS